MKQVVSSSKALLKRKDIIDERPIILLLSSQGYDRGQKAYRKLRLGQNKCIQILEKGYQIRAMKE